MKDLGKRLMTTTCLIAYVLAMVVLGYFYGHWFFDVLILSFSFIGTIEIYKSFKSADYKPYLIAILFYAISVYPTFVLFSLLKLNTLIGLLIPFIVSVLIAFVIFTFKKENDIKDLFSTLFSMIYPMFLMSLAFYMTSKFSAVFIVMYAIFLPSMTDTFAYLVGSTLKGKKLCPTISPKKTISGFVGGIFGSMLTSVVFLLLFEVFSVFPKTNYIKLTDAVWKSSLIYLAIGFVGAFIFQIGDMAASRVKRQLGIKDFGKIFPGHGGALDRLDSIMFSIAYLLVCFSIIY